MPTNANSDRPWMTALEMQFAALAEAQRGLERINRNEAQRGDYRTPLLRLIRALKRADAYAWSGDTAKAVGFAAQTIPFDSRYDANALQGSAGWWWFDQPPREEMRALLWHHEDESLWLHVFADAADGTPLFLSDFVWLRADSLRQAVDAADHPRERVAGVDANGKIETLPVSGSAREDMRNASTFYVAACAWLQQRIVTMSSGHVERHRRKQLAREHDAVVSDVKVIQLRRSETSSRTPSAGGDPVDWSCRWIVGGHWRNQPYKDERKLIYITPYVKGPEDKPLKVPTHTVYQVSR